MSFFRHNYQMTGPVACLLEQKLKYAYNPIVLTITDQSAQHRGHAGAHPDGESHFSIHLVSTVFDGQSRIDRHRSVHNTLGDELISRIHALSLKLETPSEIQK